MEWVGEVLVCAPSFRRNFREVEVEELARLLEVLQRVKVGRIGDDAFT